MKLRSLGPLLCLLAAAGMLALLCLWAGTPKQTGEQAEPEPLQDTVPEETEEPAPLSPLTIHAVTDGENLRRFSFTLEELIACVNGLSWRDSRTKLLPSKEDWSLLSTPETETSLAVDLYSVSQDPSVWFLPTVSAYLPPGEDQVRKLSLDLDEHSDTENKHEDYRILCRYVLRACLPQVGEDKLEALYETLDRQAYQRRYDSPSSDQTVPCVLYYQGEVGVFPFFALGEYERITILPVTQEDLAALAARGTQLVDLDQWQP